MNSLEKFYRESLYPLQDGVLNIIKKSNTPFYLTGGTALSRVYLNHRYSDDLDFFVNDDAGYPNHIGIIAELLNSMAAGNGFRIDGIKTRKALHFTQFYIHGNSSPDTVLKLEFVNDIPEHYGGFEQRADFGKVDSWRNILSNKITALTRCEPKDIADIWALAKSKQFVWKEILFEAKAKENGLEPDIIYNLLCSVPESALRKVKWVLLPDFEKLKNELRVIADDILYGVKNTLKSPE